MRRFVLGHSWCSILVLAALAGGLALGTRASAQVAPYAMFSAGHYSGQGVGAGTAPTQSGGITSLGGTFGFFSYITPPAPARAAFDARLVIQNSANSTPYGNKLTAGTVGLRVDGSGIRLAPVTPYVQVEVGAVYQFQFGGDFALLIPHLQGRVEYGAGQLTSSGATNHTLQTFAAGLVFRFDQVGPQRRCCRY
jgi:hypothetical protein